MTELAYEILSDTVLEVGHYAALSGDLYGSFELRWDEDGIPTLLVDFHEWAHFSSLKSGIDAIGQCGDLAAYPTMRDVIGKLEGAGFLDAEKLRNGEAASVVPP